MGFLFLYMENKFLGATPIVRGYEIRQEKAVRQQNEYEADKAEAEKYRMLLRTVTIFDQDIVNFVENLVFDFRDYEERLPLWGGESEVAKEYGVLADELVALLEEYKQRFEE